MTTDQSHHPALTPTTGQKLKQYGTGLKLLTVMRIYTLPYRTLLGQVLELHLTTAEVTDTLSLLDIVICMYEEAMLRRLMAQPPVQTLVSQETGAFTIDPSRIPSGTEEVTAAIAYAFSEYLHVWLKRTRQLDNFETDYADIMAEAAAEAIDVTDVIIRAEDTDGIPKILWRPRDLTRMTIPLTDGCIHILAALGKRDDFHPDAASIEEAVKATVNDAARHHWSLT